MIAPRPDPPPNESPPSGGLGGLGFDNRCGADDPTLRDEAVNHNRYDDRTRRARIGLLLADIAERAASIRVHADIAQTYCEIGDDAGATYALKCCVAHFRAAAASANELTLLKGEARR